MSMYVRTNNSINSPGHIFYLLISLMVLWSGIATAMPIVIDSSTARTTVSLNGTWNISGDKYTGGPTITVPGMTSFTAGITRWSRTFTVNLPTAPKVAFIEFGGVVNEAVVKLNGAVVGQMNAYSFQRLDVTQYLLDGPNQLEVVMDDRLSDFTVPGGPTGLLVPQLGDLAYASPIAWAAHPGIYRDVKLVYSDKPVIDNVFVRTSFSSDLTQAGINIKIRTRGQLAAGDAAYVAFVDSGTVQGTCAATPGTGNEMECNIFMLNPSLWEPDSPNMYDIFVSLADQSGEIDAVRDRTGLRKIETRQNQFYLNNRRLFLRGISRHDVYGANYLVADPAIIEQDLLWLKYSGVNFIRSIHYPPDERFLRRADELGLLIMEEIPAWASLSEAIVINKARAMTMAMVERDTNRPSVILWAAGSVYPADAQEYFPSLKESISNIDGTRPVTLVFDDGAQTAADITANVQMARNLSLDFFAQNGYWNSQQINDVVSALPADMPTLITEWTGTEGSDTVPIGTAGVMAFPSVADVFGNGSFPEWYQAYIMNESFNNWLTYVNTGVPNTPPPIAGMVYFNWTDFEWTAIVAFYPGHNKMLRVGLVDENRVPKIFPLAMFQDIMNQLPPTLQ